MFEATEAWVEIDQRALCANLERLSGRVGSSAAVIAVVKADAYGHGATDAARVLRQEGVEWLAVARFDEGLALRQAGIDGRLLLLDPLPVEAARAVAELGATAVVSSVEQLRAWSALGEPARVHLKVDCGLSRLGIEVDRLAEVTELLAGSSLVVEGVMGHLSESEALDDDQTPTEELRFQRFADGLESTLLNSSRPLRHLANSCGAMYWPTTRLDLVRCGGALWGLDLARVRDASNGSGLEPVMRVVAPLVQIRRVAAGTRVGYGGTLVTARPSVLGAVAVGYADGYPSILGRLESGARALWHGHSVPIAGAVSMDLLLLDLTDVANARGDEALLARDSPPVVLLGRDGEELIRAAELARAANCSLYEVTTRFGQRLPRCVVRRR